MAIIGVGDVGRGVSSRARRTRVVFCALRGGASLTALVAGTASAQSVIKSATPTTEVSPAAPNTPIVVTTTNVRGTVALNRFTDFQVAGPDVVQMVLPTAAGVQTTTLVNLVDSANGIRIDGTVEGRMGSATGDVGGHLLFAAPGGIVVGGGAKVYAGRVSLVSASGDKLQSAFDASDPVAAMLGVSTSGGSAVTVGGSIYAPGGVAIHAPTITIGAAGVISAGLAGKNGIVGAGYVQTTLPEADRLIVGGDGAIELVADKVSAGSGAALSAKQLDYGALTAGGVRITARDVNFAGGSTIDAWDADAGRGGAVTITARQDAVSDTVVDALARLPTATASVVLNGAIDAREIGVTAATSATTAAGIVSTAALAADVLGLGSDYTGLQAAVSMAKTTSTIAVGSGARIEAHGGALSLGASTDATADADADRLSLLGQSQLELGVVYAQLDATASVTVGGTLKAAGAVTLSATNKAMTRANAVTYGRGANGLAVTIARENVAATVDTNGSAIDAVGALTVKAYNQEAFEAKAASYQVKGADGKIAEAGGAAVVALRDVNATATLGGTVNVGGAAPAVSVTAGSDSTHDVVTAETLSGNPPKTVQAKALVEGAPIALGQALYDKFSKTKKAKPTGDSDPHDNLAAAFTLELTTQGASATIAPGARVSAGGATIDVAAKTRDGVDLGTGDLNDGEVNNAASAEVSVQRTDAEKKQASTALAFSVGIKEYVGHATIGEGAIVDAGSLAVTADTVRDLHVLSTSYLTTAPSLDIDGIQDYAATLDNGVFTSQAVSAAGTGTGNAYVGSVAFNAIDADTRAWVDSRAALTLGADSATRKALSIAATTTIETTQLIGKLKLGAGASGGDRAGGAALGLTLLTPVTIAGIGDGATITSDGTVTVKADATLTSITVAALSAAGKGLGVSGTFGGNSIDGKTHATISNSATIGAAAVDVDAVTDLDLWSTAGALATSDGGGTQQTQGSVGASGAANLVTLDTRAAIEQNDADDADGPVSGVRVTTPGRIAADDVTVDALGTGRIGTLAVAGAYSGNTSDTSKGAFGKLKDSGKELYDLVDSVPQALTTALATITAQQTAKQADLGGKGTPNAGTPSTGFGVAGSATATVTDLDTSATISGATVTGRTTPAPDGPAPDSLVRVSAAGDTDLYSVSGAGTISRAKANSANTQSSLAGAIAIQLTDNQVSATIADSNLSGHRDVDVLAVTRGDRIAAGLGLAVDLSAQKVSSRNFAASVSYSQTNDSADAAVTGGSVTGLGLDRGAVRVGALDSLMMGIGSGGITYGGKAGMGIALTVADAGGGATASVSGKVSNFGAAKVLARNAAQVISVGAALAVSTRAGTNQFFGAGVVNLVDMDAKATLDSSAGFSVGGTLSVVAGGSDPADWLGLADRADGVSSAADDYAVSRQTLGLGDTQGSFDTAIGLGKAAFDPGARVLGIAGGVGYTGATGGTSAGINVAYNQIDNDSAAAITGTGAIAADKLVVSAGDAADILGASVGAAIGGQTGAMGSLTVNRITGTVAASIGAANATIGSGGASVTAAATGGIYSLAGQFVHGNSAGGAAVAYNELSRSSDGSGSGVSVALSGTTLNSAGDVLVGASNSGTIRSAAASGANAKAGAALTGAATANVIQSDVGARVTGATIVAADGATRKAVTVDARSVGAIDSLALGVAFGQSGADGWAVSANRLDPTVTASVSRSSITAASLAEQALVDSAIRTLAAGVGKANFAGAASVVVNLMGGTVSSTIADGSMVDTTGTTSVAAVNTGTADALAGEVALGTNAALGLTSTINKLTAATVAGVSGSTLTVGATGSGASVAAGVLASPIAQSNSLAAFANTSMAQQGLTVNGLAINATTTRRLRVAGGAVAVGNVALGASLGVNMVEGASSATLSGSNVAATGAAVDVRASNIVAGATVLASLAASSGSAGIAGAANAEVYSSRTEAVVSGGSVTADALAVNALATRTLGSLAAGGGTGSGAAALAGVGLSLAGFTSARVGGGATIDTGALAIAARDTTGLIGGALGVGVGSQAGLGAGLLVVFNSGTTEALLGDDTAAAGTRAATVKRGTVSVTADSDTDIGAYAAAGGASLGVGAAGTGIAVVQKNATHAIVRNAAIGTSAARAGAVAITADNTLMLRSISGAAGIVASPTGAGIGLGATMLSVQSDIVAQALDSAVYGTAFGITAHDDSAIDTNAWTAAIGGAALSANALYVQFGSDASGNALFADRSIGGTGSDNSNLAAIGTRAPTGGTLTSGDLSADDRTALQQASGAADAIRNSAGHRILANVGGTSVIDASNVAIEAAQGLRTITRAGNIAAGPIAAAGTVGLIRGYANVVATVDAGAAVTATGDVSVTAGSDERLPGATATTPGALDASYPGAPTRAAEGYAVLGTAAVTGGNVGYIDVKLKNAIAATVAGRVTGGGAGTLTIAAKDGTDAAATTLGLSTGLASLSGSIARAVRQSTTAASLSGTTAGFGTTDVKANDIGQVQSLAIAGTGTLIGGASAAYAQALNTSTTSASIAGTGSVAGGATSVSANTTTQVAAKAIGVSVAGGVAVGASIADAAQAGTIAATVGAGASVKGALTVSAVLAAANGPLVSSNAIAGAGALLAGAVGTRAGAANNANVIAQVGAVGGSTVGLGTGALSITATRGGDTAADATGIGAGGIFGLGANFATADGTGTTSAILGQADGGQRGNAELAITATGNGKVKATATAGSGGVVAGAGADARTTDNSTTTARFTATPFEIGTSGVRSVFSAGKATISATGTADSQAAANTVTAAAFGASGAIVRQTIGTTTLADIGAGAMLNAGYIAVQANGSAKTGSPGDYVADAGSGGIANGAAIDVYNNVTPTVRTQIGAGAALVQSKRTGIDFGAVLIGASNSYTSDQTARMNTYSAVASPLVKLATNAVLTTDTVFGDNAQTSGEGYTSVRASNTTDIDHQAYNKVYGGASYGAADVATDVTGNARVTLGTAAQVVSLDDVRVTATSGYAADSESQVYNWTFAPLSTDADASARVTGADTITFGTGSNVLAGGDLSIAAAAPLIDAKAHWEEHSTWRAALGELANLFGANVSTYEEGDGDTTRSVTGGVNLLGGVNLIAGAFGRRAITIGDGGGPGAFTIGTQGFDAITFTGPTGTGLLRFGSTATTADDLVLTRLPDGSLGIGAFTARGGDVTIDAPAISSVGATNNISAQIADIDITNAAAAPISIGGITVSQDRGGTVKWSGGTLPTANLVTTQAGDNQLATIDITSSGTTGGINVRGTIEARTADLSILVEHGNYNQTAPIAVRGYSVNVPNGNVSVDLGNQTYSPISAIDFWRGQAGINLAVGGTSGSEVAAIAAFAGFLGSDYYRSLGLTGGSLSDLTDRVNRFYVSPLLGASRDNSTLGITPLFDSPTTIALGAQTSWAWGANYRDGVSSDPNMLGPVSAQAVSGLPGMSQSYTPGGRADIFSTISLPSSVFKQGWDTTLSTSANGSYDAESNSFLIAASASAAKAVTSNAVTAQNIFVNAAIIDLNGKINVGGTPSRTINISPTIDSQFRNYAANRGLPTGTLVSINTLDPLRDPGQPSYSYVVGENRYVVDDIAAAAGPRAIFRGIVLNTNPKGTAEIVVNDGQGAINIVNTTSAAVTVNKVDAGAPRQGSVEFQFFDNFTRFQHDSANGLVISRDGGIDLKTIGYAKDGYTPIDGSSAYYNPAQGSVFTWTDSAKIGRSGASQGSAADVANIHNLWVGAWGLSSRVLATSGSYLGYYQRATAYDGVGVAGADFTQRVTTTLQTVAVRGNRNPFNPSEPLIDYAPIGQQWNVPLAVLVSVENTARADFPIKVSFTGDPVGKVNLNSNGALTLNGPISNPTGPTTISATRGLTIGATTTINTGSLDITNLHGGIGALTAPLLVTLADGGTLKANAQDWYAKPADIALNIQGGDVVLSSVHATGDIAITALEGSLLGTGAQTAGVVGNNITLSAPIGNVGTLAKPVYIGYSYGRDAYYDPNAPFQTGGGAGDTSQPDAIGILNADARDGISIVSQGPMRVGLVSAPNAPVRLQSLGGDIVSASANDLLDPDAIARLAAAYDALKLRGADSDDAIDGVVTAFNAKFARDLSEYALLNKGLAGGKLDPAIAGAVKQQAIAGLAADIALVANLRTQASVNLVTGKVALSAAQVEGMRGFASLQLGRAESDASKLTAAEITGAVQGYFDSVNARIVAVMGRTPAAAPKNLSAAQVVAYARMRQSTLNATFTDLFGTTRPFDSQGLGSNGQAYAFDVRTDTNLRQVSFTARDGTTGLQSRYDSLIGGATWQDQWLDVRIPGDALVPVSSTQLTKAPTNVIGGTIDIIAGGNVGGFTQSVVIHYTGDSSKLTATEKAVLASAGSGDVTYVTNADGSIDFSVARDRLLQVQATGAVNVTSQGRAFVGSKGDLGLGLVYAGDGAGNYSDVRLVAGGSIVSARDTSAVDIWGNALRLEAGSGAIGSRTDPIAVIVQSLESARAAQGIAIDSRSDVLRVGNIYAGGFLSLGSQAIESIFDSKVVHIRADGGALFSVTSGIGTADRALQLASGNYELESTYGGIYVNAPTGSLSITGLHVDNSYGSDPIAITAAQNLTVRFDDSGPYRAISLGAGGLVTLTGSANMLLNDSALATTAGIGIRVAGSFALDGWTIGGVGGGRPDLTIDGSLYMPFLDLSTIGGLRINGTLTGDYGFTVNAAGTVSTGVGATIAANNGGSLSAGTIALSDRSTIALGGDASDTLTLNSIGAIDLGKVTGTGRLALRGQDITLLGVVSNSALDAVARGTLKVARGITPVDYLALNGANIVVDGNRLLRANQVMLNSGTSLDTRGFTVVAGNGGASLTSAGDLIVRNMATPGLVTLRGANVTTGNLTVGGLDLRTSGAMTIAGMVSVAGLLSLDGATLAIAPGMTLTGNDVRLTTTAAIDYRTLPVVSLGSLSLTSAGAVTVGALSQSGTVVLRGTDVSVLGNVTAGIFNATATGTLGIADGTTLDANYLSLVAPNAIDATRFTIADGWQGLTLQSVGDVSVGATSGNGLASLSGRNVTFGGALASGGVIATATNTLAVTHDLATQGSLTLHAATLAVSDGVALSGRAIDILSGGAIDASRFALTGGGDSVAIVAGGALTVGGFTTSGALSLSGQGLTVLGALGAGQAVTLRGGASGVLLGGNVTGRSVDIAGASLLATSAALSSIEAISVVTTGTQAIGSIAATGDVTLTGNAISTGNIGGADVAANAGAGMLATGAITATGVIGLGGSSITTGALTASGNVAATSQGFLAGAINGNAVTIDAGAGGLTTGAITASDALKLSGVAITTGALAGNGVTLTGVGPVMIDGAIDAGQGFLSIDAAKLTITGADAKAAAMQIFATGLDALGTTFAAAVGNAGLQIAGNATIGGVSAGGGITLAAQDLLLGGDVTAIGALGITAGAITIGGPATLSGRGVTIDALSLDAPLAEVKSDASASIMMRSGGSGTIDLVSIDAMGAVTATGQAVSIGKLDGAGESIVTGTAVTLGSGFVAGDLTVTGGISLTIAGHLTANNMTLFGDTVSVSGLDALNMSISGRMVTLGDVGRNGSGGPAAGNVKVRAFEDFTLLDGAVLSGIAVDIGARSIFGGPMSILNAEQLRLDAADQIDFGGTIFVSQYGNLRAGGGADRYNVGRFGSDWNITVSYDQTPLPDLLP